MEPWLGRCFEEIAGKLRSELASQQTLQTLLAEMAY